MAGRVRVLLVWLTVCRAAEHVPLFFPATHGLRSKFRCFVGLSMAGVSLYHARNFLRFAASTLADQQHEGVSE